MCKIMSITFFITVLIAVLAVGLVIQENYEENITLDSKIMSINVYEYMPFKKDSKIVTLNEESTLKLKEKFPIVDGAAALFPVYSAFVNSIYDEEIFTEQERLLDVNVENDIYYSHLDTGNFQYNNTVEGYKKLAEKQIDIFFGGYPSEEQIQYAENNNTTFEYFSIGREAFVFLLIKIIQLII